MLDEKTDCLYKEIDLIQDCIRRMAHNGFIIKGWALTIMAGILTLTAHTSTSKYPWLLTLIPLAAFWHLDAVFLQTERKYRRMYDWVLEKRNNNDYTLQYNLNAHRFDAEVPCRFQLMFSKTLFWFYGLLIALALSAIVYQAAKAGPS